MNDAIVTIFNFYESSTAAIWYPHVLSGCLLYTSLDTRMAAGRELMKRLERAEGMKADTGGIVIVNNIPRPGKE